MAPSCPPSSVWGQAIERRLIVHRWRALRRSGHLRARVVFRRSCAARRRKKNPKSSSWSMRLRRRARDGRRAWDCRARDFDRVSGRRQQPRQCSARRCCGELQKSFAAAEASCTPLLLVLWTMGCVCVLGVVAARPGLIGVPWSPHKPTGKRGLDVLSAVAKRDVCIRGGLAFLISPSQAVPIAPDTSQES